MEYILKTTYPCLIKTQSQTCELDINDNLKIQDEELLFVYPQDANAIPFYINLTSPYENGKFSVLHQSGEKIILLERQSFVKVVQKESLNFSGTSCDICVTSNSVSFETNSKKICVQCSHSCKNYQIFKIKNFACVQFLHDFYAFLVQKNKLVHISGDEFELNGNILKVTKNIHDSLSHEKNSIYKFEDDIEVESENFVSSMQQNIPNDLTPFKLMECMKAKDFAGAFEFLDENLKEQIDKAQLSSFFGNFLDFLPISPTEFITFGATTKNFVTFSLNAGKIDDISVDAL